MGRTVFAVSVVAFIFSRKPVFFFMGKEIGITGRGGKFPFFWGVGFFFYGAFYGDPRKKNQTSTWRSSEEVIRMDTDCRVM